MQHIPFDSPTRPFQLALNTLPLAEAAQRAAATWLMLAPEKQTLKLMQLSAFFKTKNVLEILSLHHKQIKVKVAVGQTVDTQKTRPLVRQVPLPASDRACKGASKAGEDGHEIQRNL